MSECRDLGDPCLHRGLNRLSRKAGRRGILRWNREEVTEDLNRYVYNTAHGYRGADLLDSLIDQGFLTRTDDSWYQVIKPCRCSLPKISPENSHPGLRPGRGASLVAERLGWLPASALAGGNPRRAAAQFVTNSLLAGARRPMGVQDTPNTPRHRRVRLAQEVFPAICHQAGIAVIPMEYNWTALAQHLRRWQEEGTELDFIEEMMREFGRNPQWALRSQRPAWQVFVGRRSQLARLVASAQQRDPQRSHRYAGTEYWLGVS